MRTEQNGSNLEMTTNKRKEFFLTEYLKVIGKLKELDITCLNDLLKSKDKLLEDEYCFSDWLIDDGIAILKKLDKVKLEDDQKLDQVFGHAEFLLKQSQPLEKGYIVSNLVDILSFVADNCKSTETQLQSSTLSNTISSNEESHYYSDYAISADNSGYFFIIKIKGVVLNWIAALNMSTYYQGIMFN